MTDSKQDEQTRTETARDHDDSDLIDRATREDTPGQQGRAGGAIGRQLGTRDARKRVDDPEGHTSVEQADESADIKSNEAPGSV